MDVPRCPTCSLPAVSRDQCVLCKAWICECPHICQSKDKGVCLDCARKDGIRVADGFSFGRCSICGYRVTVYAER